ncbi:DDE-type integrase/transposase/recombinase, partial [Marseilla massiliensis]
AANQLWVADITYIPLECGGTCYLHIVTDAYSHKVVGHKVSPSLRASESLEALRQAIAHAVAVRGTDSLDGLLLYYAVDALGHGVVGGVVVLGHAHRYAV